ncbi:MAG TPA: hypothetical protein VFZ78_06895 [Flavisolibacter sp.]
MTLRNLLKVVFALLIFFVVAVGLTSIEHPIILKWVTGSARHHGRPIPATVYANGQLNDHIKVFYTDEENEYLLCLAANNSLESLEIILLDLADKWIGRPVATSKNDYDLIAGHLFQSEAGEHFSPFEDTKGFNADPQLTFTARQIKFNMPPDKLGIDSIRIILP